MLVAVLISAALLSMSLGLYPLSLGEVFSTLLGGGSAEARLILFELRLPRLVMAILAGAGLALAGALMQGTLRNDLATPGLMGVQAGGQAAVMLTLALTMGRLPTMALPLASLLGASATLGVVLSLSYRRGQLPPQRVILVGLAVSMAIGSLTSLLSMFLPMMMFDYLSAWMAGSLERSNWTYVGALLPWLIVLAPLALTRATTLNVIGLGEDPAVGLGVRLQVERALLLLSATAISAACAAVNGGVAFLGLLSPHIARRLVGQDYRAVLPVAMLIGPALLVTADTLGRVLTPIQELPAGVLVTGFGGPYFLWLLTRRR